MFKLALALLLSCSAFCLVTIGAAGAPTPSPPLPKSPLDPARPETWQRSVAAAKEDLARIAQALIAIAQDSGRPNSDRIDAVLALGKINNKESITFLLDNIKLWIDPGITVSAEDGLKGTPCTYALYRDADCNIIPAILERIAKKKTDSELFLYVGLLEKTLTKEVAQALIASELAKEEKEGPHKQNLEYMKKMSR